MGLHIVPTTTSLVHRVGGVSFSDYSKLKVLYLTANADSNEFKAFNDVSTGSAYQVPAGYVFIAGRASHYMDFADVCGIVGESTTSGGTITKQVLAFGEGTTYPGTNDVVGWFASEKYVTGSSSYNGKYMRTPTLIYGVEVLSTPAITIQYDIGGYLETDYNKLKLLVLPANATDAAPKTFHTVAGANYVVPENKVFIAGRVCCYLDYATNKGRIGESDTVDGAISREVLYFSKGLLTVIMMDVMGTFTAGKYVTGESTSGFSLRTPTYLYGVEIDV